MGDPQVLHAALLAAIESFDPSCPCGNVAAHRRLARAVVELHCPTPCTYERCKSPGTHRECAACGAGTSWAECLTIRAVAGELGVDLNE